MDVKHDDVGIAAEHGPHHVGARGCLADDLMPKLLLQSVAEELADRRVVFDQDELERPRNWRHRFHDLFFLRGLDAHALPSQ